MSLFIKDSSGIESLTTTIVSVGFLAFVIKFLLSGFKITSPIALEVASMDSGTIAAYAGFITPLLAAYVARRNGWGAQLPPTVTPQPSGQAKE